MKLHLPSGLRKALLACLAAIAAQALPFTVSSATALTGSALFTFLNAHQLTAQEEEDDEEESLMPLAELTSFPDEISYQAWTGQEDEPLTAGYWSFDAPTGSGNSIPDFLLPSAPDELANINLMFIASGNDQVKFTKEVSGINSLYLTGSGAFADGGMFKDGAGPKTLYIQGAQLNFSCWNGYEEGYTDLITTFVIGECNYTGEGNMPDLHQAALRLGKSVSTSGDLVLLSDAKIAFQGDAKGNGSLSFGGALLGAEHTLTISQFNEKVFSLSFANGGILGSIESTGSKVTIALSGSSDYIFTHGGSIAGTLQLGSGTTLKIGGDLQLDTLTTDGGESTISLDPASSAHKVQLSIRDLTIEENETLTIDEQIDVVLSGTVTIDASDNDADDAVLTINGSLDASEATIKWRSSTINLRKGGHIGTLEVDGYGDKGASLFIGDDLQIDAITLQALNTRTYSFINTQEQGVVYLTSASASVLETLIQTENKNNETAFIINRENVGLGLVGSSSASAVGTLENGLDWADGHFKIQHASLTLGADSTIGSLHMEAGSSLALADHTLSLTSLSINKIGASIQLSSGGSISGLTSATSAGGMLTIHLTGWDYEQMTSYALFTGGSFDAAWWNFISVELDDIDLEDIGLEIAYNEDGSIFLQSTDAAIWKPETDGTFTWSDQSDWTQGDDTNARNSVVINAANATGALTIESESDQHTGNMTVRGGAVEFDFHGNTLTIDNNLIIASGASAQFADSDIIIAGNAKISGLLVLTNGDNALTLTGTMSGSGTLELAGSDTTTLLDSLLGQEGSSIGHLKLSDRATAGISGKALGNVTNSVTIGAESTLKLTSAATQTLQELILAGSLNLGSNSLTVNQLTARGSSATLSGSLTIAETLSGSGTISLQAGASLDLQSATAQTFAGSLSMAAGSSLTLGADLTLANLIGSGNATITAKGSTLGITGSDSVWSNGTLSIDDGTLMLSAASKMTLGKGGSADGLTLGKGAELSLGGNFIINSLSVSTEGAMLTRSGGTAPVFLVVDTGTTDVSKALSSWFTGIANLSFGEGTGLGKTGSGKLTLTGGGTINGAFYIEDGSVQFDGAAFTISGPVSGAGTLIIATASNSNDVYVTLSKGGSMTGLLEISPYGGRILIGDNLTVGGLTGTSISRNGFIGKTGDQQSVTFTMNVANGTQASISRQFTFDEGINVIKDGKGMQSFNGGASITGDLSINAGSLSFGSDTQVSGLLKGSGNLVFSSGTLTLSSISKHSFSGSLLLGDTSFTNATLSLTSELTVSSLTNLSKNATLQNGGSLTVSNDASFDGNLTINSSSLSIEGDALFNGNVDANQSRLTIDGDAAISEGSSFKVRDNNSAIRVKGTIKGSAILQLWGAGSITLDQGGSIDLIDQQYNKASDVTLNIGGDLHFNGFSANNSAASGGYLHITNTSDEIAYMVRHVSKADAGSITTWDELVKQIKATDNFNIDSDVGFSYATAADIELSTGSDSALGHAFKIHSGAIYFGGTDESYSFAQETLVAKNATLGIRSGATVTLTGGISGAGSLALNGGSAILGSGKDLSIDKLELAAAGSAVTLDGGGKLSMAAFTRTNGSAYTLQINITGLTSAPDAAWTYQLFDIGQGSSFVDGWWDLIDLENISVTGLDTQLYKVVIDDRNGATGKLRLVYASLSGLYHEVGADGFTWKEETTDTDWLQNAYNSPIDSGWTTEVGVHLRAAEDADESVVVSLEAGKDGIVQAKDLTIDGGSIIFEGDKLYLAEGLQVQDGAEALFSAELELGKDALLHGAGTVGVTGSGSTLTLDVDRIDADNNAQNGEKFTGTLKAADGGTLELTGAWADDTVHFDTASGILSLGSASKSGSFSMGISSLEVGGLHFAANAQLQMSIEGNSKPAVSSTLIIGQDGITGLSSTNKQEITFGDAFAAMTSSDLRQLLGKTGVRLFDVSAWENKPTDWNQWFTFTDPTDENAWRYSLKLKEDGLFVYTINPNVEFIWDGTRGNKGEGAYNRQLVWSATDADHEWWLHDQAHDISYDLWVNNEDATVVFRNGGNTDEVVIDGKVSAGKVTIESGRYVFHTRTSANKDDLTFTGKLIVQKGASIEFGIDGTVKNHGTAKGGADRVDWYMANVHLHDVELEGSMEMTGSVEILGALTGSGDITISGRIVTNKAEESSDLDLMLAHTDDYQGRIIFADCATDKLLADRRIAGRLRVQDKEGVELKLQGGIVLGKDGKASNGLIEYTAEHQKIYLGSLSGSGQLRLQGSNHSIAAQEQYPDNLYKSYFGELFIEKDSMDFMGGLNVYDDIVVRLKEGVSMTVNGIRGWLGNYGGESDASDNSSATLYVNLTENINTGANQQSASIFTFKKGFTLVFNGGNYTQALDSPKYYNQEGVQTQRDIFFENDLLINSGTLSVRYRSQLLDGEVDLSGGVLEFRDYTYITSTFVRGEKKDGILRLYNVTADVVTGGETGILQFAQGNNAELNLGGDFTVAGLSFADKNVNDTHIRRYQNNNNGDAVTLTIENFGLDFNGGIARQLTIHEGINTIFEQDVKIA